MRKDKDDLRLDEILYEALLGEGKSERNLTVEEFEAKMEAIGRMKEASRIEAPMDAADIPMVPIVRRKKAGKLVAAAAAAVLVIAAVIGTVSMFVEPATADKNKDKHEGTYGDMQTIESINSNDPLNIDEFTLQTEIWEEVESYRAFLQELRIPEYFPQKYDFLSLNVVKKSEVLDEDCYNYKAEYVFINEKENTCALIQQSARDIDVMKTFVEEEYEKIVSGDLTVYVALYEESQIITAICIIEDEKLSLTGNISKEEAIKVLTNFNN